MSFGSKRILINMGVGIVMLIAYLVYALGAKAPLLDDIKAWALLMLIFIGIGIVVIIVFQVLFHILYSIGIAIKQRNKGDERIERIISATVTEDERDKRISLTSMRIGYSISGIGVLLSLVALALGFSTVIVIHILFGLIFVGNFAEGIASVFYHEKGI